MTPLYAVLLLGTLTSVVESRPRPRGEAVVSYTTVAPPPGDTPPPLDVYSQIATNIATTLTQPIVSFFGFGDNKTEENTKTSGGNSWDVLQLLEGMEDKDASSGPKLVPPVFKWTKDVEVATGTPPPTTPERLVVSKPAVAPLTPVAPLTSVTSVTPVTSSTWSPLEGWSGEEEEEMAEEEEEMDVGSWVAGVWVKLLHSSMAALQATWNTINTYFTAKEDIDDDM